MRGVPPGREEERNLLEEEQKSKGSLEEEREDVCELPAI
jgi:hypothetical protein